MVVTMRGLLVSFAATFGLLCLIPPLPAPRRTEPAPAAAALPVPVAVTPRPGPHASRSAHRARLLEVTCYLPTGHATASGVTPRVGMAAANSYPFGTRLMIRGVGPVTVTDRSAPGATDVDVFMVDRSHCIRFGRQQLLVEVIS